MIQKKSLCSTKIKYILSIHFQDAHIFGIPQSHVDEKNHNVVQLNPDEDKHYLLTPYPTLMQPLKKFSPESIRAIARIPNIDLQSIGKSSKSDIKHHIRTQQFQELPTQMDTIQRQSIDQNLTKLAETAGFADIYTQDYSGYFKDIKDYIYFWVSLGLGYHILQIRKGQILPIWKGHILPIRRNLNSEGSCFRQNRRVISYQSEEVVIRSGLVFGRIIVCQSGGIPIFNLHDPFDNIPLSKLEIKNIFPPNTEKLPLELLKKY